MLVSGADVVDLVVVVVVLGCLVVVVWLCVILLRL